MYSIILYHTIPWSAPGTARLRPAAAGLRGAEESWGRPRPPAEGLRGSSLSGRPQFFGRDVNNDTNAE